MRASDNSTQRHTYTWMDLDGLDRLRAGKCPWILRLLIRLVQYCISPCNLFIPLQSTCKQESYQRKSLRIRTLAPIGVGRLIWSVRKAGLACYHMTNGAEVTPMLTLVHLSISNPVR